MGALNLKADANLSELQQYVADMVRARGFENESLEQQFVLFLEESGELARAARKAAGIKFADDTRRSEIGDEAADVLLMLLAICNKLDIDLEKALQHKEAKNNQRTWK